MSMIGGIEVALSENGHLIYLIEDDGEEVYFWIEDWPQIKAEIERVIQEAQK
jgi:hypothetical protein